MLIVYQTFAVACTGLRDTGSYTLRHDVTHAQQSRRRRVYPLEFFTAIDTTYRAQARSARHRLLQLEHLVIAQRLWQAALLPEQISLSFDHLQGAVELISRGKSRVRERLNIAV